MTKNHELSQVCLDRAVQFGIFMLDLKAETNNVNHYNPMPTNINQY